MTQLRRFIHLFIVLLLSTGLPAHAQQYLFDHFSTREGLANDVINDVYQDARGFMYISTNAGLTLYDGSNFRTIPLRSSGGRRPVIKCVPLSNGQIWVNYAGNTEIILIDKEIPQKNTLPSSPRITITNIKEGLAPTPLLCSDQGLFAWHSDTVKAIPAGLSENNRLYLDIIPVGDSTWLVTRRGLSVGLINRFTQQKITESLPGLSVTGWAKDPAGNVWLATDNHGLCIVDGAALRQSKIVLKPLPPAIAFLASDDIFCITAGPAGEMLIGTYRFGLINWHPSTGVTIYNTSNGLSSNTVKSVLVDKDNNWWIGTNNGLDRLSSKNFRLYNTTLGLEPSAIYATEKDPQNRIWFFGNDKIHYLKNNLPFTIGYPSPVEKITLQALSTSTGLWVATPNHLFRIDTRTETPSINALIKTTDVYRRMLPLDEHKILVGGKNSLVLLSNNKLTPVTDSIIDIRALHKDRFGHIWVGTFERGIYRLAYNKTAGTFRVLQHMAYENKLYPRINCFYEDQLGNVWAGTRFNGIMIYQTDSLTATKIHGLTEEEGLSNNFVTHICATSGHTIWVAHNTGFDKVTFLNGRYIIEKTSDFYSFNNSVTRLLPDGNSLWGASDIGAFYFSSVAERKSSPVIYLKEISFPDTSYQLFATDTAIRLSPRQHSFAVSFTAPFYYNEKNTRYFYRLNKKHDTEWIEIKGNHSVNFNSLQPGDYTLEIKAVTFNGQETTHRARLALHLAAPFYRSIWFIGMVAITLLVLVYSLYRYRIRELKKLYTIRDNISRNLHDEIGATLSSINIYSDIARKKISDQPEATQLMERIYNGSEQVMNSMNDIVWFVNPKNDSLDNIVVRMREYCIPVLEAKNITISFEADEHITADRLSMEQRQHIYYIFKEAINNMVKYAGATIATIRLYKKGKTLVLLVADNGKGFNTNKPFTGNGLTNMHRRAELIHGKLSIVSSAEGTRVELQLPLT